MELVRATLAMPCVVGWSGMRLSHLSSLLLKEDIDFLVGVSSSSCFRSVGRRL